MNFYFNFAHSDNHHYEFRKKGTRMQWYEAGNSLKEYLDKKSKNLGKITSVALNVMDEDKTYLTKKMQSFIGPHQGQAAKRIFNKNQYDTILFNEENNKP